MSAEGPKPARQELLDRPLRQVDVAVLDLEMTGLDPERDAVCEVAIVRSRGGVVLSRYAQLVQPPVGMSDEARRVVGLSDADLADAPPFAAIAEEVEQRLHGALVVGHRVDFDLAYLQREFEACGRQWQAPPLLCTLLLSRRLFAFPRNNLAAVCKRFGVEQRPSHRALADATANHALWQRMLEVLEPDPTGELSARELSALAGALAPNSPLRLRQHRELRQAWRRRQTVVIDYQSSSDPRAGVVRREIGIWLMRLPYLQAWCYLRSGERVFRLERIRAVEPGERSYDIPSFSRRI